jgi:biotin synthase
LKGIDKNEATALLGCRTEEAYGLFARANAVRLEQLGRTVKLCGVLNAKSGMCPEDCKFCPQSVHSESAVECYPLVNDTRMMAAAKTAKSNRSTRFGIVTSGEAVEDEAEIQTICRAVSRISKGLGIHPCASLGTVKKETLERFRDAGLTRYHCNLETSRRFFGQICTTHDWSEAVKTIRAAKSLGMSTCSGGLFGLGESLEQRVELLEQVRELDVDSVPLNFLNPIPGTPLEDAEPLTAIECLKVIAVARLMMPKKTIRVCGGREHNLRDLQSWALIAGADGLMIGGYLTTKGRKVDDDLKMISDAGFEVDDGQ